MSEFLLSLVPLPRSLLLTSISQEKYFSAHVTTDECTDLISRSRDINSNCLPLANQNLTNSITILKFSIITFTNLSIGDNYNN